MVCSVEGSATVLKKALKVRREPADTREVVTHPPRPRAAAGAAVATILLLSSAGLAQASRSMSAPHRPGATRAGLFLSRPRPQPTRRCAPPPCAPSPATARSRSPRPHPPTPQHSSPPAPCGATTWRASPSRAAPSTPPPSRPRRSPRGPSPLTAGRGPILVVVQFVGPIKDDWRARLQATGVRVVTYLAQNSYLVHAAGVARAALARYANSATEVRAAFALDASDKLSPGLPARGPVHVAVQTLTGAARRARARPHHRGAAGAHGPVDGPPGTQHAAHHRRRSRPPAPRGRSGRHRHRTRRHAAPAGRAPGAADGRRVDRLEPRRGVSRRARCRAVRPLRGPGDPAVRRRPDRRRRSTRAPTRRPTPISTPAARSPTPTAWRTSTSSPTTPPTRSSVQGCDGHGTINASILAGYNAGAPTAPTTDANGFHYGLGIEPRARIGGTTVFRCERPVGRRRAQLHPDRAGRLQRRRARLRRGARRQQLVGREQRVRRVHGDLAGVRRDRPRRGARAAPATRRWSRSSPPGTTAPARTRSTRRRRPRTSSPSAPPRASGCSAPTAATRTNAEANDPTDIADFSSRGPTTDGRIKPDLVAPGIAHHRPHLARDRLDRSTAAGSAASRRRRRSASRSPARPTPRAAAPRTPPQPSPGSPPRLAGPIAGRAAAGRRRRWSRRC